MVSGSPDFTSRTAVPNLLQISKGTVGVTETEVAFTGTSSSVYLENTHASNTLSVRFEATGDTAELVAGQNLSVDVADSSVFLTGSGAGTSYLLIVTYG